MGNTSIVSNQNTKRIIYFDLLKVIATFAVIVIHCSVSKLDIWTPDESRWQICLFFDCISRWSVPVFVMISGALFLKGEHSIGKILKKNIFRIITAFVFWSTLYGIYKFTINKFTLKPTIATIITGHYHLWFMFMIAGLYLSVPLLKKITESKKLTVFFLILSLIFSFIIPMVKDFFEWLGGEYANIIDTVINNTNFNITVGYTGYFVLGFFLSECDLSPKTRKIIYVFGGFGFILTFVFSSVFSCITGSLVEMFFENFSVFILLESICVFTLFKYNKFDLSEKKEKVALSLSKYSFGVYLVHPMIIETLRDVFGFDINSFNIAFSLPLLFVITSIVSFVISAILNHIPVLKKYIV